MFLMIKSAVERIYVYTIIQRFHRGTDDAHLQFGADNITSIPYHLTTLKREIIPVIFWFSIVSVTQIVEMTWKISWKRCEFSIYFIGT